MRLSSPWVRFPAFLLPLLAVHLLGLQAAQVAGLEAGAEGEGGGKGAYDCHIAANASVLISWNLDHKSESGGTIIPNQNTLRWLKQSEGKIAAISIIGAYRSGESQFQRALLTVTNPYNTARGLSLFE